MRNVTIKGIPDQVYERLKRRAAANRRSLNSEIIVCLEKVANDPIADPRDWLDRADQLRERLLLSPLTDELLLEIKTSGRP